MRIGINLLYLLPEVGGGSQTYALSLLEALRNLDCDHEFYFFTSQEAAKINFPEDPRYNLIHLPFSASSRPRRYFWEQLIFPHYLKEKKIDLIHSLGYVCPLKTTCGNVVSILDVNYVAMKQIMSVGHRLMLPIFVKASARRSDHIITISNFSKSQIIDYIGVEEKKITVTHLGPPDKIHSERNKDINLKEIYGINHPYICAFSSNSLHKNIPNLLLAFKKIVNHIPHDLVLIGNLPEKVNELIERADYNIRVKPTGYVPKNHLPSLLSRADLFVFPSWYEGFGLPVLEAQKAGVPVICSNAASIPEIGGEGAIYFDPFSIEDIAAKIIDGLDQDRIKLIEAGRQNLQRFSWEKTAKETLKVYEDTMALKMKVDSK